MASRRLAREQALQALYSIEIGRREPNEAIAEVVGERSQSEQRQFVNELVFGVIEYTYEADASVARHLTDWSIDRLPRIDLIVLRMAYVELTYHLETPTAVVLNEAVELVKRFSTDDSARFVNGVLGSMVRERAQA